ncbi:membrane-bound lytic murein transglycosylase D [Verrucomicrobium sp. GAS474]|uniref:LysM peptidoglycan-binding domain-containing protein n=1 Tax=Verrucomicrobium sp. GAS474 TaxID=1882831 RepID=UPI00087B80D7|nr:LysM peptidoglycan-binding domain-containing protein [Verrucomicrobium sp. GAS474]SDU28804.1 membrane-bound lytic murein transglycosylase D [Verrucomicrobium sp. GAS474]
MKNPLQGMAARISRFRFNTEGGHGSHNGLADTEGSADGQTGGLKLMTVFIVVLALHLVVIGGISAWHFIKGPSEAATDETAKSAEMANATPATPAEGTDATASTDGTASKDAAIPTEGSEVGNTTATTPASIPATPANAAKPVIASAKPATAPATPAAAVPKPAAPAQPVADASAKVYVVKAGDTLHRVAKQNGMSVAQLKEMNHLTGDMLKIGQKLSVTGKAAAPAAVAASAPASAQPAAVATVSAPAAPAVAAAASVENHSYTVAKGDTLTKIAKQFKVTPAAIMAANSPKLSDPKKLKIGEILTIPVKGDRHEVSQGQAPASAVPTLRTSSPDLVMNK